MDSGIRLEAAGSQGAGGYSDGLSLYVHIPFCETKCHYCDFNTYAGIDALIPGYLNALETEIRFWGGRLSRPAVSTVFFGGGTPSYVPIEGIEAICAAIFEAFDVDEDAETTLESNPGDYSKRDLSRYLGVGINRLSIGVQSLDDGLLKSLSRRHDSGTAIGAYRSAREAGFEDINLDLMFGLPGQTADQWRATLERAVELGPEHLSLYALTVEEGTPLDAMVKGGEIDEPDPDLAAEMYLLAESFLGDAGFDHYEISNWSLPGRESRHNLAYWLNASYLGVGPGAHSYLSGRRFAALRSPRRYVDLLSDALPDGDPVDSLSAVGVLDSIEPVTPAMELADTMMMGMRLSRGVRSDEFRGRFGLELADAFGPLIDELSGMGLLVGDAVGIRLSDGGRLLGNEVFERFVTASAEVELPPR
ncbi:MAG: radical SAM family heme chaperone HemW [Dehalococcoidia bacterium]|jgi:oxygen-independent coproporphyrinogen-3 oxidase|nr:radical SAM family heme chaperone HemW [Dehalococcoidia bacterium]